MSSPFEAYTKYAVEPGAKERIEKRLKDISEINKNRPCKRCVHYNPSCIITCRSMRNCNFNHDNFEDRMKRKVGGKYSKTKQTSYETN